MDFNAQAKLGLMVELDTSQVKQQIPELQRMLERAGTGKFASQATRPIQELERATGTRGGMTRQLTEVATAANKNVELLKKATQATGTLAQEQLKTVGLYTTASSQLKKASTDIADGAKAVSEKYKDAASTIALAHKAMRLEATLFERLQTPTKHYGAKADEIAAWHRSLVDTLKDAEADEADFVQAHSTFVSSINKISNVREREARRAAKTELDLTKRLIQAQQMRERGGTGYSTLGAYQTEFGATQTRSQSVLEGLGLSSEEVQSSLRQQEDAFRIHYARLEQMREQSGHRQAAEHTRALADNLRREEANRNRALSVARDQAKQLREAQELHLREYGGSLTMMLNKFQQQHKDHASDTRKLLEAAGVPAETIEAQLRRQELAHTTHVEKLRRVYKRLPWAKRWAPFLRIDTASLTRAATIMRGIAAVASRVWDTLKNWKNAILHTYWTALSFLYAIRNVMRPMRTILQMAQNIGRYLKGAGKSFFANVADAAGDVQQMRGRMSVLFGDMAGESIRTAMDEAIGKPFDWTDIIRGMQRAMAMGLPDIGKDMLTPVTRLGLDLAAAFESSAEDAAMAIMQATYGSWQRMTRSFGFVAEQAGPFGYAHGDKSTAGLQKNLDAILGMLESRLGGTATKMSYTWKVLVSNMRDIFKRFSLELEQAGVLDVVNAVLIHIRDVYYSFKEQGVITKWAQTLATAFNKIEQPLGWLVARLPKAMSALIALMEKAINKIFTYYERAGGMERIIGNLFEKTIEYGPLALRLLATYLVFVNKIGMSLAAAGEVVARVGAALSRDPESKERLRDMAKDLYEIRGEMDKLGKSIGDQSERMAKAVADTNKELEAVLEDLETKNLSADAAAAARTQAQTWAARRLAQRMMGDNAEDVLGAWDVTPGSSGGLAAAKKLGAEANRGRVADDMLRELSRIEENTSETAANTGVISHHQVLNERIRRRGMAFAPMAVELGWGRVLPPFLHNPAEGTEDEAEKARKKAIADMRERQRKMDEARRAAQVVGDFLKTAKTVLPSPKKDDIADRFKRETAQIKDELGPIGDAIKQSLPVWLTALLGIGAAIVALRGPLGAVWRALRWAGRGVGGGIGRGWQWLRGRFGRGPAPTPSVPRHPDLPQPVEAGAPGAPGMREAPTVRPGRSPQLEGPWARGYGTRGWQRRVAEAIARSADANVARQRAAFLEGRGTASQVDLAQLEANVERATRIRAAARQQYGLTGRSARGARAGRGVGAGLRGAGATAARGAGLVGTALLATELLYGVVDAGADISDRIKVGDKQAAWGVGLAHGYKGLADLVAMSTEMSKVTQWIPGGGGPLLGNLQRMLGGRVEDYLRGASTLAAEGIELTHTMDTAVETVLQGISDWLHRPTKDKLDVEVTIKDTDGRPYSGAEGRVTWRESSEARRAFSSTV
jgi:hypothetical protein